MPIALFVLVMVLAFLVGMVKPLYFYIVLAMLYFAEAIFAMSRGSLWFIPHAVLGFLFLRGALKEWDVEHENE